MKKILLGFIAIGLLTFVGCEKDDDTETTDDQTVNNTQTNSNNSSDDSSTDADSDDGTTETTSGEAKDPDGYTYKTVIIGEHEWFAENLKTSKYNDGTAIPNVTNDDQWKDLTTGAWCHYDNDNQYDTIYGKLYNWYTVETGKLCPTGWHVWASADWDSLYGYLYDITGSNTGTVIKSASGWDGGVPGTDDYGWKALPGGIRSDNGAFGGEGVSGRWWTSIEDYNNAWCHYLAKSQKWSEEVHYDDLHNMPMKKVVGMSVRCVKD